MSEHAKFSPSGASRWLACPGSVGLEALLPDRSSSYADEGSAAHELAKWVMTARVEHHGAEKENPRSYIGEKITIGERTFVVDEEMARHVETYAEAAMIWSNAKGALREVEQQVEFGSYLGVSDDEAFGTVDFGCVDTTGGELIVQDFKYGMGVKVYAESNEQMMLYALGYLRKFELIADFTQARLVIHQPRLDHVDEWVVSIRDLEAFGERAARVVTLIGGADVNDFTGLTFAGSGFTYTSGTGPLVPGEKQCRFCKAKATCPALRAEVNAVVVVVAIGADIDDFTDLTAVPSLKGVESQRLGAAMDKVWILEDLATAIRAEVERRLLSEEPVNSPQGGYKIVQGKRGNRAWSSEEAAEAALKSFRLKGGLIYTYKLKGPAPIEKLLAKESPTRWKRISKLIVQPEGKPSVAPMSDGRPALTKAAVLESFEDLTGGED